ncbi:MAG: hypothetical protein KIS81_07745 [Maricaulaceae bacterium]|nr:hypothetical protein [Maricaulaceae bacterium]
MRKSVAFTASIGRRLSLPDWAFYPVAALVLAGMIAFAMSGRAELQGVLVSETRLLAEGEALANLIPGPGTSVVYDFAEGASLARSVATLEAAGHLSAGVGLLAPAVFERAVIGRRIRVSVEMRAADSSLTEARLGYFTTEGHDSGWRAFEISEDYAIYAFEHDISPLTQANNEEWVGVWPDAQGLGRGVYVRRLQVDILPAEPPS